MPSTPDKPDSDGPSPARPARLGCLFSVLLFLLGMVSCSGEWANTVNRRYPDGMFAAIGLSLCVASLVVGLIGLWLKSQAR